MITSLMRISLFRRAVFFLIIFSNWTQSENHNNFVGVGVNFHLAPRSREPKSRRCRVTSLERTGRADNLLFKGKIKPRTFFIYD